MCGLQCSAAAVVDAARSVAVPVPWVLHAGAGADAGEAPTADAGVGVVPTAAAVADDAAVRHAECRPTGTWEHFRMVLRHPSFSYLPCERD